MMREFLELVWFQLRLRIYSSVARKKLASFLEIPFQVNYTLPKSAYTDDNIASF
jgi:hypothetical protein